MDSDDIALPGALCKLIDAIKGNPAVGQVHCYSFRIDENGCVTRDALHRQRQILVNTRPLGLDYKRELILTGSVTNGLRTYRKAIFDVVGPFNENIRYGIDYHMALRVVDKYEIQLVPEFLYCIRKHPNSTTDLLRFKQLRFW